MRMAKTKILLLAVGVVSMFALPGCDMIQGYFRAQKAAKVWEGDVEEITYAKLDKDGKVFDIEMHSRIDAPVDEVWDALKQPELLADNSDQYKLSKLLKEDGNAKELELHVLALGNLQQFTVRLTFDDASKSVKIETLKSSLADIAGSYELEASPDGTKTLYVYKAIQTDKVALPISTDVQRSALKESFVSQINAIKKQLGVG